MKIRTQLIISIVLFGIALLIIAASIVATNQQVEHLNSQQQLAKKIELEASELRFLSNDYILYNENQQLDRWNTQFAEFSDDVSKLSTDVQEQQSLVNSIKASQQRLNSVFDDIVVTMKNQNLSENSTAYKEFSQISWSRLAVQTRGIIFDASRLSQMLHDQENQVKQTGNLFIMTLLGAFGVFILTIFLMIFGRTIKAIGSLKAGAKIIGSGNLDYRIKENKGDEVGELAEEFNQMTARLKTVTASKTELEKEISDRKQAEEKLAYVASFPELNPSPVIEINDRGSVLYRNPAARRLFPNLDTMASMASSGASHPMLEGLVPAMSIFERGHKQVVRDVEINGIYYQQAIHFLPEKKTARIYFTDINERKRAESAKEQLLVQLKAKTAELQDVNEEIEVKNEELAAQSEELACTNEELQTHNEELQSITQSLSETQNYLESLINNANAPIIVWDPRFTITRFNHAFERLSGYTAMDVLGKDLSILFPDDSREEILDKIKKTLAGEQWESVEIPIRHKNGNVRIALWNSANIYDSDHNLLTTIAQGQDITRRKQAEKELEESKVQAELYLDLMGHDISNMHQIMMMQMEIAQEIFNTDGKLECEDREIIDSSVRTLEKAAKLINNVRKLQKLRSGEYTLEAVDLAATLKDVLKDYSSIPGKDITIKYSPDGHWQVLANPLLKDIFSNLVDNAVKHSSGPLEIVVEVNKVSLNGSSYYRVAIEDNGNGIPDNMKEEVFHRFRRGQTNARGTGLGLYLVKSLVEGFGGYVEIENRVLGDYTKGTRFLVYLPMIEGEKNAAE